MSIARAPMDNYKLLHDYVRHGGPKLISLLISNAVGNQARAGKCTMLECVFELPDADSAEMLYPLSPFQSCTIHHRRKCL